jgi:hypothetical protein
MFYNDVSLHDVEKELLIKSIVTTHGRVHSLPGPYALTTALPPPTPDKFGSLTNLIDSPSTAMAKLSTSPS